MLLRMCCKILGRRASNEQCIVTNSCSKCTGHLRKRKKDQTKKKEQTRKQKQPFKKKEKTQTEKPSTVQLAFELLKKKKKTQSNLESKQLKD